MVFEKTFLLAERLQEVATIKFLRGSRELVSPEKLCAEVHSAFMQKTMSSAAVSDWIEPTVKAVNVEYFIAGL